LGAGVAAVTGVARVAMSRSTVPPESAERHRDQADGAKCECSEVEVHGFSELKVPLACQRMY
jgi:hypothetical protein